MNIFGIGPLEIIFVLIIGILVLGPEGMIEAGRKLGKFMRSIIHSPWWKNIRQGVTEIQHLPQRLIREAELEELNELRDLTKNSFPKIGGNDLINSSWSGLPPSNSDQSPVPEEPKKDPKPPEKEGK
jgi:Sec-independent protein translocase protein TatA